MYKYRANYSHKETIYNSLYITANSAEEAKRIAQAASFDNIESIELIRPASRSERKEAEGQQTIQAIATGERERQKVLAVCKEVLSIHEAYAVYDMIFTPEYDEDDVLAYMRWCGKRYDEGKSTEFEEWIAETAIERTGAPSPNRGKAKKGGQNNG